jgi:hypothetical protein
MLRNQNETELTERPYYKIHNCSQIHLEIIQYWLLLWGGIVQSVTCNCDHFLMHSAPHLCSNHSRFFHQSSVLWLQQTPSSEAGRKWVRYGLLISRISIFIIPQGSLTYRKILRHGPTAYFFSEATDFYRP